MSTRGSKKLFCSRIRIVWFSYKYNQFSHLLKRVDFDVLVDHLALTYIIKSKAEPATAKIKRLLELISFYSFNLYYIKGKDMILSDFLLRQKYTNSNPHEIIPISFNMHNIPYEKYYNVTIT